MVEIVCTWFLIGCESHDVRSECMLDETLRFYLIDYIGINRFRFCDNHIAAGGLTGTCDCNLTARMVVTGVTARAYRRFHFHAHGADILYRCESDMKEGKQQQE